LDEKVTVHVVDILAKQHHLYFQCSFKQRYLLYSVGPDMEMGHLS